MVGRLTAEAVRAGSITLSGAFRRAQLFNSRQTEPVPVLRYAPAHRLDTRRTLSVLSHGGGDPTFRRDERGIWCTARTPAGPATLLIASDPTAAGVLRCETWGPGDEELLASVPGMLGEHDDPSGFAPAHPLLSELAHRYPGLRVIRTGRVYEALVPAVLEQKVTGKEARGAWRWLVNRYGEPAPGPGPSALRMCPPPDVWARIPSWDWHRAGVDGKRSRTIIAAARVADALERTLALESGAAIEAALRAVPGIGIWTAAEIAQRAHGDADAVSVGDYHLAHHVGWALTGHRVDDARMLELLEPYRPHRFRVTRLIELGVPRPPAFGPKLSVRNYAAI
jgi:3-methyladenine DNA glycosylase/8-oxoguanine DNA glycosylase